MNDIPFWYKEGAIRYNANGWTIQNEDKLRNSFYNNNFTDWIQVINYEPRLAGQAFCYFLNQKYYPKAVAQTFFQLKKKKSLPRALRLITKHSIDSVENQCFDYYTKRFKRTEEPIAEPTETIVIPHRKGIVQQMIINPGKTFVAYTILAKSQRTVYIYDIKNKITQKVTTYKLPPWIDEHASDPYPLLQWHKDGIQLFVAKSRKGKIEISRNTPDGKKQDNAILVSADGIIDFQPLSDNEFLLSGYRKGQCDIVTYNDFKEKYTAYTDDEYDDSQPVMTGKKDDILFISERPEVFRERRIYLIGVGFKHDTLWQGIYKTVGNEIKPIIIDTTSYVKWDKPVLLNDNRLLLTCTKTGQEKNVLVNLVNNEKTPLNQYTPFQYLSTTNQMCFYTVNKDSISISLKPFENWLKENKVKPADTLSPWLADYKKDLAERAKEDSILNKAKDTTHYFLDNVFSSMDEAKKDKKSKKKSKPVSKDKVVPYVLQLHSAYFSAQVNNDYFINRYQPYLNYQGEFKFPEVGGMTKGGFTDLLENHDFTIVYRLPAATEGSDFFIKYENKEKKVDWGFSYFRKVETLKPDPSRNWVDENGNKYPDNAKVKTHYYEFFLRVPITYYSAFEFQSAVRYDRTIFLATDKYSLDFLPISCTWSINTLSYKLNKLIPTLPQLFKGFKASANIDLFKGFSQQESFLYATSFILSAG